MKVVQIVTQMEAGGAQRVAYTLHRGLQARTERSELWFLYTKRAAYALSDGVISLFDRPPKPLEYAVIAARLYRRLRESRPDVVITHTHYSNVLGQAAALAAGVPSRVAVHHGPLQAYPGAARIVDRIFGDRIPGQTGVYTAIVAVSDTVAASLRSYPEQYRRLVTTIHNGVELPPCDPGLNVRARHKTSDAAPLLVGVGRLSKPKNHALLLRALADIPAAHLAIVGGGELRDELAALAVDLGISNRVHFVGEVAPEAVASYLSACDVFVFPSLWEGLPMAAIEALHAGAAIVASDIPASREVLGNAAVMAPVDDQAALTNAILRVLQDPALAQDLRGRAKRRAMRFTARAMIDGYLNLCEMPAPQRKLSFESRIAVTHNQVRDIH
jgi:glycosyltransferase involved in cell wall biosynthesis